MCLTELMGGPFAERTVFSLSPEKVEAAHRQWRTDHTGPLSFYYSSGVSACVKDSSWFEMEEFKQLPAEEQRFIKSATVPTHEMFVV